MALLQISEPGLAPDPHQRRWAVGIDLGTTHSLVAAVRSGVAECLPDEQGRVILPSVVRYTSDTGRQIGFEALSQQALDPANTISSVKRLMGRALSDLADPAQLPYNLIDKPGMVGIATRAGDKSPVEVSAEILATLRQRAEDSLDDELFGAVITVPAYFDDAQRQATKDAAKLAGLNVLRLINEPTAAAIAYGLDNASEGIYAVYDLGGGTFDVSILRLSAGVFEVLATGGDAALGGDDYDQALLGCLLEREGMRIEPLNAGDKANLLRLARACKESLSTQNAVDFVADISGLAIRQRVSSAELEACTVPLTARTMAAAKRVLRDSGLSKNEIKGVVMVGGSTRMPSVRQAVAAFFETEVLTELNPDEVVALGAAIQANQLAGNGGQASGQTDLLLLDVTPLSLGIETMGGLVERIVPRNQSIPTAMAQDFTTYQDGQTALALHVVQGERDLVADCRSLARFELRGIPPMAAGAARIRVSFTVDADGLLQVSAKEQLSGVEASVQVKPSYGLADEEVARMLREGFATAEQDMAARALAEARLDAQRTLLAVQSALNADGALLNAQELERIHLAIADVQRALSDASQSAAQIEALTQALALSSEEFAARRMNRSIVEVLKGKSLDAAL
jgi:molecular chaperone HscA